MNINQTIEPIVVEQDFSCSKMVVWESITELEQMRQWFFNNIPSFEPKVGFQTSFKVQSGDRNFNHIWIILEVVPFKKIKYHWSYEEYKGEGIVTFELFENDNKTILRLTNEGLETFPKSIPEFSRDSCQAGWEYFINMTLKEFLDGSI